MGRPGKTKHPTKPAPFDFDSACRSHGRTAVKTLAGVMNQEECEVGNRVQAAKLLLEFGYGKAKQQKEVTGANGGDIRIIIRNIIEERKKDSDREPNK